MEAGTSDQVRNPIANANPPAHKTSRGAARLHAGRSGNPIASPASWDALPRSRQGGRCPSTPMPHRLLGRTPWALLDPCNHLASVYPLLEDMDPVDAACSGLMAAAADVWSPDAQEHRGRSICISPPPTELDLLLQLSGPRRSEVEKARLELFVTATCTPLITGRRPIAARLLRSQAKPWRDHARRWCVREPDERGLSPEDRPAPPPFSPALVPDEGAAKLVSGSHPRVSALPFLRRWLCSGRAARFLWVCAAGEPDANLRLTLAPEGTWPAFLQRREAQLLDVQVELPDGAYRWVTGFDTDADSLRARLAPGFRAVPR